ncbi:glycosyltransferase [Terriglobus albidus]|uniref:glycosyltransferase n=1 Tax=Terriglobus albidus TaxID=1592106 RepID=UPI00164D6E4A|nr:glycosyltransferase [Terriglobus albidus]
MKILITNASLDTSSGTEIVARDLAQAIARAGHTPIVFSGTLGAIAEELRATGIQVTDNLAQIDAAPDIIHGHHHQPLMEALLYFPETPAIYLSHDGSSIVDEPIYFPRIRRYFAVDERCRNRILQTIGPAAGEVSLMLNAVDLDRFLPRAPLPERPRRALLFSNHARNDTYLPAVRKACARAGIPLDVMGSGTGTASSTPEKGLPSYDLVFAKARCALEAMATGCAVILCDFAGAGAYVTAATFDEMRRKNFGRALLTQPIKAEVLLREIQRYDPADAAAVSQRVRSEAGLEEAAKQWLAIYADILDDFSLHMIDRKAEGHAASLYIGRWHSLQRITWEKDQAARLKRIPMIGNFVHRTGVRLLRRFSSDSSL